MLSRFRTRKILQDSKTFACSVDRMLISIICLTIFYVEHAHYFLNTYTWHNIQCTNKSKCTRILLVADPQILWNEANGAAVVWETDRYITKTFTLARNHFQPDVVIFLGDLMDEGSVVSDSQFQEYTKRFKQMFPPSPLHQTIWIPGDNDIGGETDSVTLNKRQRFNEAFAQDSVLAIHNILFYKVDRMTPEIPAAAQPSANTLGHSVNVVLSHMPLIYIPSLLVDKVLDVFVPHLIFSGHNHKSMIIESDLHQIRRIIHQTHRNENNVYTFNIENSLHEIVVPTCSYRMGSLDVGIAGAVIEDGILNYTIFWSPARYSWLFFYFAVLFTCAISKMFIWGHKRLRLFSKRNACKSYIC